MDREALYARLPIPLQNAAATLEGWGLRRSRYGAPFQGVLDAYLERTAWDGHRLREYRDERLRDFVEHSAGTVPYYRDVLRTLGLSPADISGLDDLDQLPILTKRVVQERTAEFVSDAVPPRQRITAHTSGSTGAGLRFPTTPNAQHQQWAVWWRYRMHHGLSLTTPCLYFGGRSVVPLTQHRPPYWRNNRAGRQIMFSAYHLGRDTAAAYLDEMERSGFEWVHGYPSQIALLASFANELGRAIPMRWVSLGAESVLPHQVTAIERTFGVTPISHYGMAEGVANISLRPTGEFVVDEDFAAVEFLPRADGRFDIVGTNFTNPAFPLIRYEVGDVATLPDGRQPDDERIVVDIDGRQEDYVVTRSGSRIGRLDHVFKDMINVREAQIRQTTAGEMTLHVVRGPRYTQHDEEMLLSETRKRVGTEMDCSIEYHDTLQRTASGKLRFVVSELEEGAL